MDFILTYSLHIRNNVKLMSLVLQFNFGLIQQRKSHVQSTVRAHNIIFLFLFWIHFEMLGLKNPIYKKYLPKTTNFSASMCKLLDNLLHQHNKLTAMRRL